MTCTPKQYSDEIEALTALIHESGITPVLFEAATQRNFGEMKTFVKQLAEEHPKLWEMMATFYFKYCDDGCPRVFCKDSDENDEDDGYLVEFPKEIDLQSFVMLLMLSNGRVSDISLFENFEVLTSRLREAGLDELADYQFACVVDDLHDLVGFAHGD